MWKYLISCLFISIFLIPITRAVTCEPTISWKIDPQFFVGETGKLIATLKNPCDYVFDVKTEVNTEKTYGYIKVYSVSSEDQKPMPKPHSVMIGSTIAYIELGKKDTDESTKKAVYFIQPDELALPGTYTLYENFYVEDVLKESKEIQITVKKPLQITYRLPALIRLGTPSSSSIVINNIGTEMISSLKVCLYSNIVSFSESCKTWTNIPSKYTDTFNFIVNGLVPGDHQNAIEVKIDYTTYTGLVVSDSYKHPSLKITTMQAGTPSLSYSVVRGIGNLTFQITNKGNGTAYNCFARITSNCPLNSSFLISSSKSAEGNVYEIDCGDEIPVKGGSNVILTYNPAEMTPSCSIKGAISYRDATGRLYQTNIPNYYLQPTTTTIPPTVSKPKKNVLYVLLLILVAIINILAYLKFKKPEIFAKKSVKTDETHSILLNMLKRIKERLSEGCSILPENFRKD
ncbi:MAG: hypothetical protein QMD36_00010 [Candidatus Aenigmarchaeota archaeon]|nr:hypothetical protein [Candidatus Aenigmarchaeota archaeon]